MKKVFFNILFRLLWSLLENDKTGILLLKDKNKTEILSKIINSISEEILLTENISNFIIENRKTKNIKYIRKNIFIMYDVKLTRSEIERILHFKSLGKFELAYKLSVNKLKENKINFTESLLKLSIEMLVQKL